MSEPFSNPTGALPVTSILAVLVLYKRLPSESPTLTTLLEAQRQASPKLLRLAIDVVDNTPGGQDPGILPEGVRYRAVPENPGLAPAYNYALTRAERAGYRWLLTLDQDTQLPPDFLLLLERHARTHEADSHIAAIVPSVIDTGRLISPFRFVGGFLPWVTSLKRDGVAKRFTSALNSCSLFSVAALRAVEGYDLRFPLHNSDTRIYQKLEQADKRVVIARDLCVQHELAILQREERMTGDRYRIALEDECYFWDLHMGPWGRAERLLRLIGRAVKGILQGESHDYQTITQHEIIHRLFTRPSTRIRVMESRYLARKIRDGEV